MRLKISIVQLALKELEAIPQKASKLQLVRMYLIKKNFGNHGPVVDDTFDQKIPKNIIIDEMPEFNKYYDELYLELHKIGSRVLSVIALSLDIDKNFFTPWIEKGNSLLRSIHYPPVDSNLNPHRARAHEDINLITLLIGAEEG